MPVSKIIEAIEEYKAEYAWDKALTAERTTKSYEREVEFNYLDEFIRSSQASKQADSGIL